MVEERWSRFLGLIQNLPMSSLALSLSLAVVVGVSKKVCGAPEAHRARGTQV